MGTIAVGYDNFGTPWIAVTPAGGVTYTEIQNSIGQGYQYSLDGLYMKATTVDQLLNTVTLAKNNRRGIFEVKQFVPTVDPFQYTATIDSEVLDKTQNESLLFNGQQNFILAVNAGERVLFLFKLQEIGQNDLLQSETNFERMYDFFSQFPERQLPNKTDRKIEVALYVQNNSLALGLPQPIAVSLLGGMIDQYNYSSNADGLWTWNGFSPSINVTSVTIPYRLTGSLVWQYATVNGSFKSAQEIAITMNAQLYLSLFWVYRGGLGQDIMATSNDTYEFGNISYTGTV